MALALTAGFVLFGATAMPWAGDVDGDGANDRFDVCNNTPAGTAVDAEGQPFGDIDQDCDTDLNDFLLFRWGRDWPLAPVPAGMVSIRGGEFEMGYHAAETDHLGRRHVWHNHEQGRLSNGEGELVRGGGVLQLAECPAWMNALLRPLGLDM